MDEEDKKRRDEAASTIDKLSKQQLRLNLREKIKDRQTVRSRVPTRRAHGARRRKMEEWWDKADAAERKQAENQTAMRHESAKDIVHRRNVLMYRARQYVDKFRQWTWAIAKREYLKHPCESFAMQARFIMDADNELVRDSFLSMLVFVHHGHAWCLATDDLGGIQGMLSKKNNHFLPSRECIEVMKKDRHYSKKLSKKKNGVWVNGLNLRQVQFLKTQFWNVDWVLQELVDKNILGVEDFRREYPTEDDEIALLHRAIQEKIAMAERIAEWKGEEDESKAKEDKFEEAVRAGEKPSEVLLKDVPAS